MSLLLATMFLMAVGLVVAGCVNWIRADLTPRDSARSPRICPPERRSPRGGRVRTQREVDSLRSEVAQLARLIEGLPEGALLERFGLERRRDMLAEQLRQVDEAGAQGRERPHAVYVRLSAEEVFEIDALRKDGETRAECFRRLMREAAGG